MTHDQINKLYFFAKQINKMYKKQRVSKSQQKNKGSTKQNSSSILQKSNPSKAVSSKVKTVKKTKNTNQEQKNVRNNTIKKEAEYLTYRSKQINQDKDHQTTKQFILSQNNSNIEHRTPQKHSTHENKICSTIKKEKQIAENANLNLERIEMLKEYLKEDTQKITKIKKISDEHVMGEFCLAQEDMNRKIAKSYQQTSELISKHHKQIIHIREQFMIEKAKNLEKLRKAEQQLQIEREKNLDLTNKLAKYEFELKKKKSAGENRFQVIPNSNNQEELCAKVKIFEGNLSELEKKSLDFQEIRHKLEMKIIQQEKQKKYIKENLHQLLEFIRKQYSPGMGQLKNKEAKIDKQQNSGFWASLF